MHEQIHIPLVGQKVIHRERNVQFVILHGAITYVWSQLDAREV